MFFGDISIHALLAESDRWGSSQWLLPTRISIHALLAESDVAFVGFLLGLLQFLSTLSLRRATIILTALLIPPTKFLSTLSLRRATHLFASSGVDFAISIHALLAESDTMPGVRHISKTISIHALLAESDLGIPLLCLAIHNFYPRSPCGERPTLTFPGFGMEIISIHALLAESDSMMQSTGVILILFLSTLSLRRATKIKHVRLRKRVDFYPRSPCGERRILSPQTMRWLVFLSTLSLRRATPPPCGIPDREGISIHALLAESDVDLFHVCTSLVVFLSTLSLRRATANVDGLLCVVSISIHALLAESDGVASRRAVQVIDISIHALLAESDGQVQAAIIAFRQFLSTLSLRRATFGIDRLHNT